MIQIEKTPNPDSLKFYQKGLYQPSELRIQRTDKVSTFYKRIIEFQSVN